MADDEVFEFPCRYPIKVMGLAEEDIRSFVLLVLQEHGVPPHPDDVTHRISGGGKYISVTAVIRATSRPMLEAIYTDLRKDERIRFLL
jgi:putative lipoic acid-binding regulatory protein